MGSSSRRSRQENQLRIENRQNHHNMILRARSLSQHTRRSSYHRTQKGRWFLLPPPDEQKGRSVPEKPNAWFRIELEASRRGCLSASAAHRGSSLRCLRRQSILSSMTTETSSKVSFSTDDEIPAKKHGLLL